jgi:hypothetical protein
MDDILYIWVDRQSVEKIVYQSFNVDDLPYTYEFDKIEKFPAAFMFPNR